MQLLCSQNSSWHIALSGLHNLSSLVTQDSAHRGRCCSIVGDAAPSWAMLLHRGRCCSIVGDAAPSWAMLLHRGRCCSILGYEHIALSGLIAGIVNWYSRSQLTYLTSFFAPKCERQLRFYQ
jgi:hypothetical protein